MTAEEWRPVTSALSGYEVSSLGRVRSWRRSKTSPRIIRTFPHAGNGYLAANISTTTGRKHIHVHRLVMDAFAGPRPDGLVTRHLDGDKNNNALTNLAYGTYAENAADTLAHGTHPERRRAACDRGHPYDPANTHLTPRGWRVCRKCGADYARAKRAAEREAKAAA